MAHPNTLQKAFNLREQGLMYPMPNTLEPSKNLKRITYEPKDFNDDHFSMILYLLI